MRTAQCSAVVLGVVVLNQLRLGRALSEALRLGRGARRQEPQLALQVEQLLIRVGLHFDRLELLEQRVARQILVHLGRRDELALFVLDLLRHLLERLERALVADRRHRFLNALVRLGTLLARDQDVLLALGFLDPIVELAGPHCPAPNLRPRCSASSRSAKSNRSASSETCPCNCDTCSSSAATRCGSSPVAPPAHRAPPRTRVRIRSASASPTGVRKTQRRPRNTTMSATIGMAWLSKKFRSKPGGMGGIGGAGV